ncbi:tetratricopeptide repeat protein [Actinophytocola xanthii]|uniref:HTH cro/C1-type domain-containing protein n=1 Tax=Actinophytocola xanthii TaxID=1912961 RepID=A0A1Q8CTD1_9PSEU|nr:tetratricopeptide repeat protein [Actinophytocola xanthii]OLF17619.1 hypothetical protein BU204_10405 [Actinophytocola xanthii]
MDQSAGPASSFGELLIAHRRAAGLTQEGLAEASGLSVRALRDVERGRTRAVQRRSADALAAALGLGSPERDLFLASAQEGRRRSTGPENGSASAELSMLPPVVPDLVGRADVLAGLRRAVGSGGVVAVVGQPGVGKTTAAVWMAHELRSAYPDGCLWVDLRGMDGQPLSVRGALKRLLQGLGIRPSDIPAAEADQVDLYRSMLAGRRVLVVLDNAADEVQVRSLLATSSGSLTLVTCRQALAGLEGVHWIWLEPLAEAAAVELLARIAGSDRIGAEPAAARELVALCGYLPLAVRIAGNRLATRPRWSVGYLAGLLRDTRTRLDSLSVGDLQVRSAFEMSHRRLSPGARTVFRRLAAVPGASFGVDLAEVATGMVGPQVRGYLDELADASLLQPAPTDRRFQFHDLLRLFAAERWEIEEPPAERERMTRAVLEYLLSTASAAALMFFPEEVRSDRFATPDEAGEWLLREESSWIAAYRAAARLGWHREVLELAKAMHWFSDVHWMGLPWVEIFQRGVAAAHALGDRRAEAKLLNFVGWAQSFCHVDHDATLETHRQALAVAVETDDRLEEVWAFAYIATTLTNLGRADEALEHARRAYVLAESFDFWSVRLSVHNRLGRVLYASGRYEEALSVHRAALADAERHAGEELSKTQRNIVAFVRLCLGDTLVGLGEWRLAAETFQESRRMFDDAEIPMTAAIAALSEADARLSVGEREQARECLHHALDCYGDAVPLAQRDRVSALRSRLAE